MKEPGSADPGLTLPEPTQLAELEISLGPGPQWGTARGTVPPDQPHHLITTFGILGSAVAGTAGAVLSLRIDSRLGTLALAELTLAFVAAALIAACSRAQARK